MRRSTLQLGLPFLAAATLIMSACGSPTAHSGRSILDGLAASGIDVEGDPYATGPFTMPQTRATSFAQGAIPLADLLDAAEATHPRLAAARARVGESAGRTWQASLYPNPSLGLSVTDLGMREGVDGSTSMVTFSQPVVIGGRLRSAIDAAEADRKVWLAAVETERRELFAEVATVHATLLSTRAQETALEESLVSAGETQSVVDARVQARAAPEPDALRPRVEVARLESERIHLYALRRAAEDRLGILVGVDTIPADRLADTLDLEPAALDLAQLNTMLSSEHPELLGLRLAADAARARVALVDAQRTPDLNLGLGVGYDDEDREGVVELGAEIGFPLWDNREGDLLAARFEVLRVENERAALEKRLLAELRQEFARYESARQQLALLQTRILPDADRAFDQIEDAYRAGRSPFIEVLDAQRTLLESRRAAASLRGEAAVALAAIARLAGAEAVAISTNQSVPDQSTAPSTPSETNP